MERVFILSGPSGVGKGTLVQRLVEEFEDQIFLSVSVTTRASRAGEIAGVSYDYITEEEYAALLQGDALIEHAEYDGGSYGSRRAALRRLEEHRSVIFEIDVQGKAQVVRQVPEAVTIFILPPSMEELKRRIIGRGTETPEKVEARLMRAEAEIRESVSYQYRIVNGDLEQAYEELRQIFLKETRESRQ